MEFTFNFSVPIANINLSKALISRDVEYMYK